MVEIAGLRKCRGAGKYPQNRHRKVAQLARSTPPVSWQRRTLTYGFKFAEVVALANFSAKRQEAKVCLNGENQLISSLVGNGRIWLDRPDITGQ